MANRKLSYSAVRAHVDALQKLLDESDASVAAAEDDGEEGEGTTGATAMDSAPRRNVMSSADMSNLLPNYGRLGHSLISDRDLPAHQRRK